MTNFISANNMVVSRIRTQLYVLDSLRSAKVPSTDAIYSKHRSLMLKYYKLLEIIIHYMEGRDKPWMQEFIEEANATLPEFTPNY